MTEVNITNINGKDYIESDIITINNNKYVLLMSDTNEQDFLIRKIVLEDGVEYYEGLTSEKEFNLVMMNFLKNNKDIIKEI